ncbi:UNKNOWN [Stylonychia lemnae]|uniref:Uncharacterized protein n=1 Tax=Stylonychia lemnae TaxID=5949 RepID=A0A078AHD2_STYLE|nr:UNKNOWN [Stylonychia lemnae]|eukprot:CDW80248.1 UNKNOWN [Stylonychia lemnae]
MKQELRQNKSDLKQLSYFIEPISSVNQNINTAQDSKFHINLNSEENMTFITGVKQNLTSQENNNQRLNQSANNDYKLLHSEINEVIQNLDDKIDGIMIKHEKDFTAAYHGHMLKISKELEALKRKCNEQEFQLRKDERIQSLEKQLEWFRSEALSLSKLNKQCTREAESLRQKNEGLEEEKQFLMIQITKQKRQSKLLKMALGKTQDNCSQLLQFTKDGRFMTQTPNGGTALALQNLTENSERQSPSERLEHFKWTDELTSYDVIRKIIDQSNLLERERLSYDIASVVDKKFDELQSKILRLKSRNEIIEKEYKKQKNQQGETSAQLSQISKIFIECVDTVKKELDKRRIQQISTQPFSGQKRNKSLSSTNTLINMGSFELFQQSDKMKIIELLVLNEDILRYMHNGLTTAVQTPNNLDSNMNLVGFKTISDNKFLDGLESDRYSQNTRGLTPQILGVSSSNDYQFNKDSIINKFSNLFAHKKGRGNSALQINQLSAINQSNNPSSANTRSTSNQAGRIRPMTSQTPSSFMGRQKRLKSSINYSNTKGTSDIHQLMIQ